MLRSKTRHHKIIGSRHRANVPRHACPCLAIADQKFSYDPEFVLLSNTQLNVPVLTTLCIARFERGAVPTHSLKAGSTDEGYAGAAYEVVIDEGRKNVSLDTAEILLGLNIDRFQDQVILIDSNDPGIHQADRWAC